MSSEEIRESFLNFFEKKGHKIVPSSSLIPDDPSVLFTTAGMQQFKKYFTGELDAQKDFGVKNTVSIQKCFRTSDIDEVGDKTHLTFFQMLGHFSFGDYFKKETIKWTFKLLTDVFKISPERITARVFEGSEIIPFDKESFDIWSEYIPKERILKGSKEDNFWGPVENEGPCGACNEVYVGNIEVATLVFIEYYRESGGNFKTLPQKGVDVGWGFERLVMVVQKKENIFETDLFRDAFKRDFNGRSGRIVLDHIRGAIFLIADGVQPSKKGAGYVLRRLMRRAIFHVRKMTGEDESGGFSLSMSEIEMIINSGISFYKDVYEELETNKSMILKTFKDEYEKFIKTLNVGLHELISGGDAFRVYQSFGLPREVIKDVCAERGIKFDDAAFNEKFEKHQQLSRTASAGMFKGGLADHSEQVIKYHTAAHLILAALRKVLGEHVSQKGSNINAERLRLDFSYPEKLTAEQVKQVEDLVNQKIQEDLPVKMEEMSVEQAKKQGAIGVFEEKYAEKVKVYAIRDFSKEICGGPHVQRTGELSHFKIIKEEASSSGVRRIKAVLD